MRDARPAPEVVEHRTADEVAEAASTRLISTLRAAQDAGRDPQIALTGGSMGSAIIAALAQRPDRSEVDWGRVTVWWGDERYLPAGDPERNDTQNRDAGLDTLGLDPGRVHAVAGPDRSGSAEESAQQYSEAIRAHGAGEFEVVLLGVGPDGHVASLFPHHPAQRLQDAVAVAVHDSPKPPPDRVSLTYEAMDRTRQVWFLVAGEGKAEAVASALADGADRWDVPAAGVRGTEATLWLLDDAAASALP